MLIYLAIGLILATIFETLYVSAVERGDSFDGPATRIYSRQEKVQMYLCSAVIGVGIFLLWGPILLLAGLIGLALSLYFGF